MWSIGVINGEWVGGVGVRVLFGVVGYSLGCSCWILVFGGVGGFGFLGGVGFGWWCCL